MGIKEFDLLVYHYNTFINDTSTTSINMDYIQRIKLNKTIMALLESKFKTATIYTPSSLYIIDKVDILTDFNFEQRYLDILTEALSYGYTSIIYPLMLVHDDEGAEYYAIYFKEEKENPVCVKN